jgi:phosphatidylserine decarboxylase
MMMKFKSILQVLLKKKKSEFLMGIAQPGKAPSVLVSSMSIGMFCISFGVADPGGFVTLAGVVLACLATFIIFFHRDPDRITPRDSNLITSPADGKVMFVVRERSTGRRPTNEEKKSKEIETHPLMGDWFPEPINNPLSFETEQRWEPVSLGSEHLTDVFRVAIYMSPLDVHVQRSPIKSQVLAMEHRSGKGKSRGPFRRASTKESEANERVRTVLIGEEGLHIEVIQISGSLARTIIPFCSISDHLEQGQRYGMIRLGSRVDIRVPANGITPLVESNEMVLAGTSPLFQIE